MRDLYTFRRILFQIYSILNKKQRFQMVGMFFVILIGSLLELLGVSAMLPFIQAILEPEKLLEKPYINILCDVFQVNSSNGIIVLVGIGIVLIYIIKNAYLSLSAYLQAAYSNITQKDLAVLMLRSYMTRPYSFFVDNGSDVIMRGVQADINGVYQVMLNGFKLLSEFLVVISIAIYLMITDLLLALGVLIVGFICLLLVVLGLKKNISKMSTLSRDASGRQYKWIIQISGGIKDILVYCRQKIFLRAYEEAHEDSCKASTYYTFVNALPERIIEAFCISGIIITVLLRLWTGIDAETFVPKMAVFAMGAFRLLPSISRSTGYINAFVYYREWVESAYENITTADLYQDENISTNSPITDHNPEVPRAFQSEIIIQDIGWKYPNTNRKILGGISMRIKKGEAIGIIGESGSGKSTFADILLGLYRPKSGGILMDGVDIGSISGVWSKVIGYVPQSVFLVDDTIRENVIFGAENPNDRDVWDALHQASLDNYVRSLPDGLETIVGERGVKFSGGQRQRIAIARALYAKPQILILDEATSALDNETEEAVMEAIESLAGTITLIIIAHRVTTLKSCDKIYEIKDGKAVERNKDEVISVS